MKRLLLAALACLAAWTTSAQAQVKPYIGFVYPAGGQQGTTFRVRLGGQALDEVNEAAVSGPGVQAKVIEYFRRLNPQDTQLIGEQLRELKFAYPQQAATINALLANRAPAMPMAVMMSSPEQDGQPGQPSQLTSAEAEAKMVIENILRRQAEYCNTPACNSIANLAFVEITVAPDAEPGPREIRLVTPRGVSNPLVFQIGQFSEVTRKPMVTASIQVLGKEELAQRKRPDEEVEQRVTVPCVLNGQIASGEVNRHRFEARKGQRLVITTSARELIPYVADAVPGWFQPVLTLFDAQGKEVAYNDDYRFKPDPVILFEVPQDGEYVLAITDAIFRGREDFVYRVTIGEQPMITSIFPLGAPAGSTPTIAMKGWNLDKAEIVPPAKDAPPGVCWLTAQRDGIVSNRVPFALGTLPECMEQEPNNDPAAPQKIDLPTLVNGRIDRPDDWDVYQFGGKTGDTIVAEVYARRLDSPLDSVLKLFDPSGKLLAYSDDCEDLGSGVNTHHADSYLRVRLPVDGVYTLRLGDAARHGGEEYGYRLRIGPPQPDFELRVVSSSVGFRANGYAAIEVRAIRKDGFEGPIKLELKDPPEGFTAPSATLGAKQEVARLGMKTTLSSTPHPINLVVQGRAKDGDREIVRQAVPTEDRMQAFLWRHLVPARDLKAVVFDPSYVPPAKRVSHVDLTKP